LTTIAVFGTGRTEVGDDDYTEAQVIGAMLASAGYTVMSGGYSGIMEAVSKGASQKGGHVIGVTTAQFDGKRDGPNEFVKEEIKLPTARERLMYMIDHADGYIVLPGGIGTFAELANIWEMIRVGDMPQKPVICYGAFWRRVAFEFLTSKYVLMDQWTSTRFVETPEQAISILEETLKSPVPPDEQPSL